MMNKFLLLFPVPIIVILISCDRSPRFQLLSSARTGIDFRNSIVENDTFHVISYEYIYNGAGIGIGDLNNDGLQDIVFAGNQVSSRIYLNMGNFRFREITSNFKGLTNDQWYSGVAIVDINSDGWPDVYFTSTADNDPAKCKNRLWINNGTKDGNDPTFTEMAEEYGIDEDGQSVHAAFFDYDCDGDLDLYIINNIFNEKIPPRYRHKIVDGSAINNDKLYRNNGDGTFTDVTIEAGIVFEGYALGLAVGDINKDGYPDIYISNDYIANDLLYINQCDGTFKNEIRKYMSYQTKSSMGNDMADVNNDGNPDMFTLDMLPTQYHRKRQTINGFGYIYYLNDELYDYERQYIRNMLHLHNGFINGCMLPYSEVGQMMGIYHSEWSWSPLFADYDNDGDKDLIIANGYPRDLTDKDWTFEKMRTYGVFFSAQEVIERAPVVKVQNFAFENAGNFTFIKKSKEWLPDVPSFSNGAAFADLDNDGDLDYVTNNLNDEVFVYRNTTVERSRKKANYLKIKLTGKTGNTMALGARVELWADGKYQFHQHFLSRGYASSVDPVVHFGIGGLF
jgi:enediyne biosynthesis protein E4